MEEVSAKSYLESQSPFGLLTDWDPGTAFGFVDSVFVVSIAFRLADGLGQAQQAADKAAREEVSIAFRLADGLGHGRHRA